MNRLVPAVLSGCVLAACSVPGPHLAVPPEEAFAALETSMLQAESLYLDFHVTAEGAVEADLEGFLDLDAEGNVVLQAEGRFAGMDLVLHLEATGEELVHGNGIQPEIRGERPEELETALILGLTRMGILHNLAMLSGGAAPDHAEGGVDIWVTVDGFDRVEDQVATLTFALTVDGVPSGEATLRISPGLLPVERRQVVPFPEGEMRVVERYREVRRAP